MTTTDSGAARSRATTPVPLLLIPALLCDEGLYTDMLTAMGGKVASRVALAVQPRIEDSAASVLGEAPGAFVLVGASYGASVALSAALSAPERVQALVLAACDAHAAPAGGPDLAAGLRGSPQSVVDMLAGLVVRTDHTAAAAAFRQMAGRVGGNSGAVQATAASSRPDFTPRLRELRMPVLLLWGADDPIMPVTLGRQLAAEIANAKLVVLEGCGHLPTLEQPRESAAAILDFLQEALQQ